MSAPPRSEQHTDRVLLPQQGVAEHLTRVERWRMVLCNALLSVAEGFEANGHEYEKSGASDPRRQYELAAAAVAWRHVTTTRTWDTHPRLDLPTGLPSDQEANQRSLEHQCLCELFFASDLHAGQYNATQTLRVAAHADAHEARPRLCVPSTTTTRPSPAPRHRRRRSRPAVLTPP